MRRDWKPGETRTAALVVREAERKAKKDSDEAYLVLMLGDRSGRVEAVVWPDVANVDEVEQFTQPGYVVVTKGRYEEHPKYGPRLKVEGIRPALDDQYDIADLIEGPARPVDEITGEFWELAAEVDDSALVALIAALFQSNDLWPLFFIAPAARRNHEAYRHGLIEHTVNIARMVSTLAMPPVNRDMAITGALIHDIGKVDAYNTDPLAPDLTDLGRLHGEIPLGHYRVRKCIEGIEGFPDETATAVLHVLLSHHGALEHGSPVTPRTREACLVHAVDALAARLGAFDRLEGALRPGEVWTPYDRVVGGEAWFPGRAVPAEPEQMALDGSEAT